MRPDPSDILHNIECAKKRLDEILEEDESKRHHPLVTKTGARYGNVIAEARRISIDDPWHRRVIMILEEDATW